MSSVNLKRWVLKILCIPLAALVMTASYADTLRLEGSSTVEKHLSKNKYTIEQGVGFSFTVKASSSGVGLKKLVEGKLESATVSSSLEDLLSKYTVPSEIKASLVENVIGRDEIVVVSNDKASIGQLNHQQIRDIFTGKIKNWKEVGGIDADIVVLTPRSSSSTRLIFDKQVMNGGQLSVDAKSMSQAYVARMVSMTPNSIGVVSKEFVNGLDEQVSRVNKEDIERRLAIVTIGKPKGKLKDLVAFLKRRID